ncbi:MULTISPECIES: hypothetical protein [unclassified Streptomyces]|uniref:hypothetical protein n=1 Tax=unclassified Streptomyces TaxID=2593676 RepID=UPI000368DBDB|nr:MULTISPECIES: hypothetical protein [unclassified Streptomyces]
MSVKGKTGIVTGAGSGLGKAGAGRLAREGARIVRGRRRRGRRRTRHEVDGGQTQP